MDLMASNRGKGAQGEVWISVCEMGVYVRALGYGICF
jgi:hypothetical protein